MKKLLLITLIFLFMNMSYGAFEVSDGINFSGTTKYFYFDLSQKNITLSPFSEDDLSLDDYYGNSIGGGKYKNNLHNWLNDNNCNLDWQNGNRILTANFDIDETRSRESWKNFNYINYLKNNKKIKTSNGNVETKQILKNNLWMRVELNYEAFGEEFVENSPYNPFDEESYIYNSIYNYSKVFYLDDVGLSEDKIQKEFPLDKNEYDFVNITAKIVETKCPNFNSFIENQIEGKTQLTDFIQFEGDYIVKTKDIKNKSMEDEGNEKNTQKVIVNRENNEIEMIGRNSDGSIKKDSSGKVIYEKATIDEINKNMTLKINGETFTQSLDIDEVALILHKKKNIQGVGDAKLTLDNIVQTTNSLDLEKEILIDEESSTTQVTFKVFGETNNNTILWLYLPKDTNLSDYDFGNAENLIIRDEDPLVGWKNPRITDYKINGETIDPAIAYFEQVPIVYNSKNLVFNYRATRCADREIYLFTTERDGSNRFIDDEQDYLTSSDTLYNLCVSHFNKSINFERNDFLFNNNLIDRLNSDNFNLFKNYNNNLNYNYYISENPPSSEFSCFGSLDNIGNFGDCDFSEENRVWVYLGHLDFGIRPKIDITDLKFISNTKLKINLSILETQYFDVNVSINEIKYNLNENDFKNNYLKNLLEYECNNCRVSINVNLTANDPNILDGFRKSKDSEEIIMPNNELRCNNDCTNNYDGRIYSGCSLKLPKYCSNVPVSCEGSLKGFWERIDSSSYEVKCETPFNQKRNRHFTSEKIRINTSESDCKTMANRKIPVYIDAKIVNMVLLGCLK